MRALCLFLALGASSAAAGEFRELAPGAGAVHLQEGHALLVDAAGHAELVPTRLPAGVFYSQPGHQRLTAAFLQLQADKAAAEARADALQHALALRAAPPSRVGAGAAVVVGVLLLLAGGAAGYALAR